MTNMFSLRKNIKINNKLCLGTNEQSTNRGIRCCQLRKKSQSLDVLEYQNP
jgi:hypothetical protein